MGASPGPHPLQRTSNKTLSQESAAFACPGPVSGSFRHFEPPGLGGSTNLLSSMKAARDKGEKWLWLPSWTAVFTNTGSHWIWPMATSPGPSLSLNLLWQDFLNRVGLRELETFCLPCLWIQGKAGRLSLSQVPRGTAQTGQIRRVCSCRGAKVKGGPGTEASLGV